MECYEVRSHKMSHHGKETVMLKLVFAGESNRNGLLNGAERISPPCCRILGWAGQPNSNQNAPCRPPKSAAVAAPSSEVDSPPAGSAPPAPASCLGHQNEFVGGEPPTRQASRTRPDERWLCERRGRVAPEAWPSRPKSRSSFALGGLGGQPKAA